MESDRVKAFVVLKNKPESEKALVILKRLASQVKPILNNRNWTIKNLCEFFPTNENLLGVNVNRGWKVNLRLRPHYDDKLFLEYEEILGTLLHEMAHIVRGPHDQQFYKVLEELKAETEILMASGYSGEGFYSNGHSLGSRSVPKYLSKQAAATAAEKRLQTSRTMLPPGGIRLGGGSSLLKNMTPAQLAANAAEKRLHDQVWCGGSDTNEGSSSSSASSPDSPLKRKTTPLSNKMNKMSGNTETRTKKARVTIDLTEDEDVISLTTDSCDDGWSCPTCTFLNNPLLLACEVCRCERPIKDLAIPAHCWKCPQCTLMNEKKWLSCVACTFVKLQ
ncbi:WLM domain-containing protein [Mucor mucedo]|uniref:WLM domain-containing protein n=1 Tax=Mucor mucedo TaxID=29922 RepID=UPI00221FCD86|nr:WLM domain-containing protein [Mucor mucedo]KAI7894466.1 WLM domain-containing protein [Mucor mucedo]